MSAGFYRTGTNTKKYGEVLMAEASRLLGEPVDLSHIFPVSPPTIEGVPVPDFTPLPQETVGLTEVGEPVSKKTLVGMAKAQGYTGNQCTKCNSMRMKVSGHCEVCDDCGESSGCS